MSGSLVNAPKIQQVSSWQGTNWCSAGGETREVFAETSYSETQLKSSQVWRRIPQKRPYSSTSRGGTHSCGTRSSKRLSWVTLRRWKATLLCSWLFPALDCTAVYFPDLCNRTWACLQSWLKSGKGWTFQMPWLQWCRRWHGEMSFCDEIGTVTSCRIRLFFRRTHNLPRLCSLQRWLNDQSILF